VCSGGPYLLFVFQDADPRTPTLYCMKLRKLGWIVCLLPFALQGQEQFRALSWKNNLAVHSFLMREVHEQYRQREESLAVACESPEAMMDYVREVRRRYLDILGEMPEKTPLQAQVTGVEHQQGFRMEKIVFQSMPGRYVTASLYLPEGKGKHAVTVSLCGHGLHGKRPGATPVLLARNGIATLVVDPIGQGERWQFINEKGEYATRGATTEHTLLHAGCVAVGTSLAAVQCWDNHRAIDYLVSRADIDADRIGVWGSSGGGTETAYLIGMDERVKAAAICSYFSQRGRTLELQGPSDGCQHIPHEGEAGIELADFALMMAPRPVLILTGNMILWTCGEPIGGGRGTEPGLYGVGCARAGEAFGDGDGARIGKGEAGRTGTVVQTLVVQRSVAPDG